LPAWALLPLFYVTFTSAGMRLDRSGTSGRSLERRLKIADRQASGRAAAAVS
jgi:hypothetical protein